MWHWNMNNRHSLQDTKAYSELDSILAMWAPPSTPPPPVHSRKSNRNVWKRFSILMLIMQLLKYRTVILVMKPDNQNKYLHYLDAFVMFVVFPRTVCISCFYAGKFSNCIWSTRNQQLPVAGLKVQFCFKSHHQNLT